MKIVISCWLICSILLSGTAKAADFTLKPTVHSYQEICATQGIEPLTSSLKGMCEVVTKNELCKKVPKADLLQCHSLNKNTQIDAWEFIKGCSKGAFDSVKETLEFLWSIMELAWDSEKRSGAMDGASEYMAAAKLYLHTEYQKALARSKPPMKETKAVMSMGGAIAGLVLNKIQDIISQEYDEFGCLNFEAKSKYMCKVMSDIFLPPAGVVALLKYGPKAAKQFPKLKSLFVAKKATSIWGRYPKLQKTLDSIQIRYGEKIEHAREIPFVKSSAFRPIKADEMIRRANQLEPDIQKTITGVYNTLNDKTVLEPYFKNLFRESAEWMAKKGRPEDLKLLEKGVVTEHAIAVTLVKRFKASGDNQFTTIMERKSDKNLSFGAKKIELKDVENGNDAFRTAVRTGPFLDRAFAMTEGKREGHGVINHMIQRDIVSGVVKKEMNGSPQKFYEFLGSKKGINWWADLFDSGDEVRNFTRPENISDFMHHNLTDSKFK